MSGRNTQIATCAASLGGHQLQTSAMINRNRKIYEARNTYSDFAVVIRLIKKPQLMRYAGTPKHIMRSQFLSLLPTELEILKPAAYSRLKTSPPVASYGREARTTRMSNMKNRPVDRHIAIAIPNAAVFQFLTPVTMTYTSACRVWSGLFRVWWK